MSDIVLKNITKRFGKSVAVDNLNLTIACLLYTSDAADE